MLKITIIILMLLIRILFYKYIHHYSYLKINIRLIFYNDINNNNYLI